MKFQAKRDQILESTRSGARILILGVDRSGEDSLHWPVEIVNLFSDGNPMKKSKRTVFHDSIRRWYAIS
jgi:hypothetical protein